MTDENDDEEESREFSDPFRMDHLMNILAGRTGTQRGDVPDDLQLLIDAYYAERALKAVAEELSEIDIDKLNREQDTQSLSRETQIALMIMQDGLDDLSNAFDDDDDNPYKIGDDPLR